MKSFGRTPPPPKKTVLAWLRVRNAQRVGDVLDLLLRAAQLFERHVMQSMDSLGGLVDHLPVEKEQRLADAPPLLHLRGLPQISSESHHNDTTEIAEAPSRSLRLRVDSTRHRAQPCTAFGSRCKRGQSATASSTTVGEHAFQESTRSTTSCWMPLAACCGDCWGPAKGSCQRDHHRARPRSLASDRAQPPSRARLANTANQHSR